MDLLDLFRQRLKARVMERANVAVNQMGQVRYRPAGKIPGAKNQELIIPPSSMEDIALLHTQFQAEAQILAEIVAAIDEEYRLTLGQPKDPVDPVAAAKTAALIKEQAKGVY